MVSPGCSASTASLTLETTKSVLPIPLSPTPLPTLTTEILEVMSRLSANPTVGSFPSSWVCNGSQYWRIVQLWYTVHSTAYVTSDFCCKYGIPIYGKRLYSKEFSWQSGLNCVRRGYTEEWNIGNDLCYSASSFLLRQSKCLPRSTTSMRHLKQKYYGSGAILICLPWDVLQSVHMQIWDNHWYGRQGSGGRPSQKLGQWHLER